MDFTATLLKRFVYVTPPMPAPPRGTGEAGKAFFRKCHDALDNVPDRKAW